MDASTGSSSGPTPCGRRPSPDRRGGPAGTAQAARPQEDRAARYPRLVYSDIALGRGGDKESARVPAVISSPFWGVSDVADEGFWLCGGHVLLSGVRGVADVAAGLAASVGHLFPFRWEPRLAEGTDVHIQRVLMPVTGAESRSEEHTSELQSHVNLVCRLLLA